MTTPHLLPIPVICDLCRAKGNAGEDSFPDLADLLDFDPVPVRGHANNWTAEHQRAFIAALAVTGNVRPAARAIGRYANGAERLRKLPRGKSFAAAWDAAIDHYRDREVAGLKEAMVELDEEHRKHADRARELSAKIDYHNEPDGDWDEPDEQDIIEARNRIAERLWACRRFALAIIADDRDKQAAWVTLCGDEEVQWDWARAARFEPQTDEAEALENFPIRPPAIRSMEMVITQFLGAMER